MSTTELVKTFITAAQSGDMEMAANCLADNFVCRNWTPEPLDKKQFLAVQSALLVALPDFSYNLSDLRRERDNAVTAFIQVTGTHTNALDLPFPGFLPIESTGLAIALPQVHATFTFEGDKLREMNVESVPGGGIMGVLQQVGSEVPAWPRVNDRGYIKEEG
jgi:hypothetical protein